MEQSNCVKIFKALSNEQRLKIFMMIYEQCCSSEEDKETSEFKVGKGGSCCSAGGGMERTFTKICECMNLSRSTISHHLKELQNAGLITMEREGQTFRCRVNKDAVNAVKSFFG